MRPDRAARLPKIKRGLPPFPLKLRRPRDPPPDYPRNRDDFDVIDGEGRCIGGIYKTRTGGPATKQRVNDMRALRGIGEGGAAFCNCPKKARAALGPRWAVPNRATNQLGRAAR